MSGQGRGDKDKDKEKKPKRQFERKPPAHFGRRKRKRGGGGLAKVPKGAHNARDQRLALGAALTRAMGARQWRPMLSASCGS